LSIASDLPCGVNLWRYAVMPPLVEIPGVGHAPTLSEPASIAAIREFLAR
jgi:pimeloyl-ACP methyl ester carboxylesterase